ncbi:class I adenylate-forming enzyme family protein [Roseomonas sp. CCTCC AB2023176]|uniref:class I adenylate-forming enzyme family protein n=1 Tax=Roseomonas sp. CCTCC AB2023176 TaxID=3342640 RepID=UPI0035DD39D4
MTLELPLHGVGEAKPPLRTLIAMLDHAAATAPDVVAFRQRDTVLSWAGLARAADALAARIAATVAPGEGIGLILPNSVAFPLAYLAALRALSVPALLNPAYPPALLEALLADAAVRALACAPSHAAAAAEIADRLGLAPPIVLDEAEITRLAASPDTCDRPPPGPETPAAMPFSGGTTGRSKGIEHTHERLIVSTRCMEYLWPTRNTGEVFLPVAPFTHIYGFLQGITVPLSARGTSVIPERFKPDEIVDLMTRHRVTFFGGGPPAIYAGVLSAENLASADLSALRVCPAGGAPFALELMERWRRATGLPIHEGYGMTEIAPISGVNDRTGLRPGSVGRALPCNVVEVVDLETGTRILPAGERGEVRVRGPHLMQGYRNRPDETAATLRDGFLYTGDIGHMDAEGFVFITDRKKDVVFVKGFNVFPREVEEVLHAHPGVNVAGVVGAADDRTGGERLIAFVVAMAGAAVKEADLAAHCAARLAPYQCPSEIRLVESLPMTGAQKLDRLALRRSVAMPA